MPDTPAIDRIPLAHSVHYVARGLPEVPNQYGPGVLAPSEITLTYRDAPDSQLGRVHAYVAGRIWVDGKELPLLPGGLYGQHYFDGVEGWPDWLAEEARLHDPDAPPEDDPHSCPNCDGVDPDTCLMNPHRLAEQCPRSEFDGYGLQCQKEAGHNLCTFEMPGHASTEDGS
ncbi:hypothetical protein [Streptomyces pseudovenezuelae]|uniref:hypothetical protein n=1 Tax=Streptomyces pseudovenezuelae TaxID=67350 RepID=UPI002E806FCC|nr:hypothetical protein [Streptomyces pseudovenezuelae]WUA94488.1 hypothetical protein OHO81_44750 [Streptomyces pseudovenezuelae]